MKVDQIGGSYPTIYLFKKDNTGSNTWRSGNNTGTLTQTIPAGATGVYSCMLLGYITEGLTCLYSSFDGGQSWSTNNGCRVYMGTWHRFLNNNINSGTRFFAVRKTGDPVMYLCNASRLVVAYNDDYYPI